MLPPRPRAATTSRRQYNEEKKRRLKSTARDVKTPQLPARHDTTGKLAKLMMPDAATQTSSSDHFEESSRRYAEWDEEVRLEEVRHLWRVAIGLFEFSMHKAHEGPRPTSRLLASRAHAEAEVDDHPTRMEVSCG
ncbi:uncharacterized protein [Periplaneta americana]|uniref:uncharacterized protein n=1 Tax=Periplaneta americana TaxID=6978 RepID=UPI0037E9A78F